MTRRSEGKVAVIAGLAAALLATAAPKLGCESFTLHTYYPAPSGSYALMLTTQKTYLSRDSGVVGVGTTSPQAGLHVRGVAGRPSADIATESKDGHKWTIGTESGTGKWLLKRDIPATLSAVAVDRSGNVGVKTASPSKALEVNGTMGFSGGQGPFCIFSMSCPAGWIDRGNAGYIFDAGTGGTCPYRLGGAYVSGSWYWCHPRLCCNQ